MMLYIGVGAGVAAMRLLLERFGVAHYERQDSTWILAKSLTDVMFWPLVVTVLLLQRMAARSTTS